MTDCCGVCPEIEGGGIDCTCFGNPRCPKFKEKTMEEQNKELAERFIREHMEDVRDAGLMEVIETLFWDDTEEVDDEQVRAIAELLRTARIAVEVKWP